MTKTFEESVAHATRNRFMIGARRLRRLGFLGAQKLMQVGEESRGDIQKIVCYPPVRDQEEAADLYNRLHWYFRGHRGTVCLLTSVSASTLKREGRSLEHQPSYIDVSSPVHCVPPAEAEHHLDQADAILAWEASALYTLPVLRRLARTFVVDPTYYSTTECETFLRVVDDTFEERSAASTDRFARVEEQFADLDRSIIFATGPSLDRVLDVELPDQTLKVICNSIVRSDELLEHIQPDILTFADPVFHMGPSTYAAQFRQDAVDVIQTYDCWCLTPKPGDKLLQAHYPEIADRVIGVSVNPDAANHFPSSEALYVGGTSNIMTLLMLPVASALTRSIGIVGADGREESDSYFWKHSSIAQYEGLMVSAVETHPSFFRDRMYTDYYEQHVETLQAFIEHGEAQGRRYASLTPSHVSALSERRVDFDRWK